MLKKIIIALLLISLVFSCGLLDEQEEEINYTETNKKAEEAMTAGNYSEALEVYSKLIKSDDATGGDKLMWSLLSVVGITTDENMVDIAKSFGIKNYPSTIQEALATSYSTQETSIVPEIENVDKFTGLKVNNTPIDTTTATFLAALYNMKESYSNGFNPLVDKYIEATKVLDQIVKVLDSVSDDEEFTIDYSYFNQEPFSKETSNWPTTSYDSEGGATPQGIILGKAELYPLMSLLQFIRGLQLMTQTLDYSIEVSAYWDIFNPVDGSFYIHEGGNATVNKDFDYSTIPSPLSKGFLTERENADKILSDAKDHFINSVEYVQKSLDLITKRTSDSNFFLSPSNPQMTDEYWNVLLKVNDYYSIFGAKIIASLKDGEVLYVTTDIDFSNPKTLEDSISNWPTSGPGVNLSKLFEKPLFALDNIFELTEETYEPVLYVKDGGSYRLAVLADYNGVNTFYIKFRDITFNGVLVNMDEILKAEIIFDVVDNSVLIPLNGTSNVLVGSTLYPSGESFTFDGVSYVSTGSFYTGVSLLLIREI